MSATSSVEFWAMVGTLISAFATVATAIITGLALLVARRTLHSWRCRERLMQLVRVKRAVFVYRQQIENIDPLIPDIDKLEYVRQKLQPALTDIFHEMKLAGIEENKSYEFDIFDEIYHLQLKCSEGEFDFGKLLKTTIALQNAIVVSI